MQVRLCGKRIVCRVLTFTEFQNFRRINDFFTFSGRFALQALRKVNFNAIPKAMPKIPVMNSLLLVTIIVTYFFC